jgi:hypothetical protein
MQGFISFDIILQASGLAFDPHAMSARSRKHTKHTVIWCPYTDVEVAESSATPEHIIPLSLGGCNAFTVPVSAQANAFLGSAIDGAMANDPLLSFPRRTLDTRGHSGKKPRAQFKKGTFKGQPSQIEFPGNDAPPLVWDAKSRTHIPTEEVVEQEFSFRVSIDYFLRHRFACKVALSAGYYIYGELFRNHVNHAELRHIMNAAHPEQLTLSSTIKTRFLGPFTRVSDAQAGLESSMIGLCRQWQCASVHFVPVENRMLVGVGLFGDFVCGLNVPAETRLFPAQGDHDLGHSLFIANKQLERISFRIALARLLKASFNSKE